MYLCWPGIELIKTSSWNVLLYQIDGLVQDPSISIACTKPSIWSCQRFSHTNPFSIIYMWRCWTLQWRHRKVKVFKFNSDDCLFNSIYQQLANKTLKLRFTGILWRESMVFSVSHRPLLVHECIVPPLLLKRNSRQLFTNHWKQAYCPHYSRRVFISVRHLCSFPSAELSANERQKQTVGFNITCIGANDNFSILSFVNFRCQWKWNIWDIMATLLWRFL